MRILMPTSGGFVKGMVGWPEYGLAKSLVEKGHEVIGITSSGVMKRFNSSSFEIIDGIKVFRVNPLFPLSILKTIMRKNVDIIHSHFPGYMSPLSSYSVFLKKIKKIPYVHNVNGILHDPYIVDDLNDPLSNEPRYDLISKLPSINPIKSISWFVHLPVFQADIIIALNRFEKKFLSGIGVDKNKIEVVPLGIDEKLYENIPNIPFKEIYGIDGPMVLFVGQSIRRKGPEYAILAIKNVVDNFDKDVKLVFIGYRENVLLRKLVHMLDLEDNVIFIGYVSEEVKINAYRSADVFILPTSYEGFGIVFIEAMACGTPIVTTKTPGVDEIVVNGRNGILVEPKSAISLADGIIKILSSTKIKSRISKNNLKDSKKYRWSKISRKIENIYYKLKEFKS